MLEHFLIPLITVAIAELGDKTQFAIFALSSKTKKHCSLFLVVVLAFIIADGLAIALGSIVSKSIPFSLVKIVSGGLFIAFGLFTLAGSAKTDQQASGKKSLMSAFALVLLSEVGDKSQISAGIFAANYNPFLVFAGVITALAVLSGIAIFLGKLVLKKINKKVLNLVSGTIFLLVGIATLLQI